MKKTTHTATALTSAIMALGLSLGLPSASMAQESPEAEFTTQAEHALQSTLAQINQDEHLNATFTDVHLDVSEDTIREYNGDADAYVKDIIDLYRRDGENTPKVRARRAAPRRYTSSVFSGVPAGGYCNVKQDFEATVVNHRVTHKRLLGSSYQTGVCLFQWSHNHSWFEGNLDVLSKGTFHAVVKGSGVSFAATFRAFFHTNKDSLWQEFQ